MHVLLLAAVVLLDAALPSHAAGAPAEAIIRRLKNANIIRSHELPITS